jgi:hypothetical protein
MCEINKWMGLVMLEWKDFSMEGSCKLQWFTFCPTLDFYEVYFIQMPQMHCKIINLTKIFC